MSVSSRVWYNLSHVYILQSQLFLHCAVFIFKIVSPLLFLIGKKKPLHNALILIHFSIIAKSRTKNSFWEIDQFNICLVMYCLDIQDLNKLTFYQQYITMEKQIRDPEIGNFYKFMILKETWTYLIDRD